MASMPLVAARFTRWGAGRSATVSVFIGRGLNLTSLLFPRSTQNLPLRAIFARVGVKSLNRQVEPRGTVTSQINGLDGLTV